VDWLLEPSKHPAIVTMGRLGLLPGRYLSDSNRAFKVVSVVFASLYVLPLLVWKRQPTVALWWLWLVGTIAPVALLDFSQKTMHLAYIRYVLLAAPAVYALLATSGDWLSLRGAFKCVIPIAGIIWCLIALPFHAYHPEWRPDWRGAFAMINNGINPGEVVCCVAPADQTIWDPDGVYIELNYYLRPLPQTVMLVRDPPLSPQQMPPAQMLRERLGAWAVVTGSGQDAVWPPPGWKVILSRSFEGIGTVQHLIPTEMRGFATGVSPALRRRVPLLVAAGRIAP